MFYLFFSLITVTTCTMVNSEDNCFTKHRERFFNVSEEMFDTIDRDDYGKVIIIMENNYSMSINNTQRVLNGMSLTCRYYTDINSYKYQLQEVLLHKDVLTNELLEKITSLLINLQVAASSLQNIRMTASNKVCLEFSPEEYKYIYALSMADNSSDLLYKLRISSHTWQYQLEPCALV
ncbi:uncharacterized protein [Dysidea avara]|uniref:uncharacterized protein isoform X2 n=1 Tax=Dysidea avara TaxID=196820 RepID=UPI003320AE92